MTPADEVVAVDANVVLHLEQVGRLGILTRIRGFHFVVPEEVVGELCRPESRAVIEEALASGVLQRVLLEDVGELLLLKELVDDRRVGRGEAACLVLAASRGWLVASDDEGRRFLREAESRIDAQRLVGTPDLVLLALRRGLISPEEADTYPAIWARNDYLVDFESFSEFLAEDERGPGVEQ